jgi:hypothetical protein
MRETRATGLLVQNPKAKNSSNTPARALRFAAVGFAITLGMGLVMTVSAARAGSDDGEDNRSFSEKFVDSIKSGFSSTNMESKGIDYHERSPLVVPPQLDLPPPAAAAAANAPNWPKDPDEKRRKAALAARKKAVTNAPHELTPAEAEAARASAAASDQPLPQQSFGERMSTYLGGAAKPEVGQFKGEPTRETLTQPPPGYQTPSPNYGYGVGLREPRKDKSADNKDANKP